MMLAKIVIVFQEINIQKQGYEARLAKVVTEAE